MNGTSNTLRNCLITGSNDGNQHFAAGVGAGSAYVTFIDNCTIVGNTGRGIGPYGNAAVHYRIANTISYYNTGDAMYPGPGGTLIASNSCATATNYITAGSTANTTNNPSFVNYAAGNYRLKSDSPCVNKGANRDWMANAVDLDGRDRIYYDAVDMGAYELIYDGSIYKFR